MKVGILQSTLHFNITVHRVLLFGIHIKFCFLILLENVSASCFKVGIAFPGHPITGDTKNPTYRNITSAEECQRKCQNFPNDKCKYFTWSSDECKKNKNTCWLKSAKLGEKEFEGKISGPKFCPALNSSIFKFYENNYLYCYFNTLHV